MTSRIAPLLLAALCGASCAKAPPPRCPDESSSAAPAEANLRVTTTTLPTDPTAGGRLAGAARAGPRAMKGVLLLDYSGSMYAGYDRPEVQGCARCTAKGARRNGQPYLYGDPAFQRFLTSLLKSTAPVGTTVNARALLFNKGLWTFSAGAVAEATSPQTFPWALSAMTTTELEAKLGEIPVDPFRATGMSANETHMRAALEGARDLVLIDGDEGLIWFVTDNIADQSGGAVTAGDAQRNLNFYRALKDDPRFQLVYAYPIHHSEACTWLCGSSLFAYAIHVSRTARADGAEVDRLSGGHLSSGEPKADGLLWNSELKALMGQNAGAAPAHLAGVPLRLKPMDLNAVSVSFERTPEGKVQPLRCKRTAEFGDAIPCVATVVVKNTLRHERIDSARLTLEGGTLIPRERDGARRLPWAGAVCQGGIRMTKATAEVDEEGALRLGPLDPGQEQRLQVRLLVPPVAVAPTTIGEVADVAGTDALVVDGPMTARVRDVRASLVVPAGERERVYGAASLPAIFVDRSEAEVKAVFPVVAVVNNDGKLQALLLFVGIVVALLIAAFVAFVLQPAYCTVIIDGTETDRLRLTRLASREVEVRGVRYGRVKRGFSAPYFVPQRGAQARRAGSAWMVAPSGGSEARVELRLGWRSTKAAPAATSF